MENDRAEDSDRRNKKFHTMIAEQSQVLVKLSVYANGRYAGYLTLTPDESVEFRACLAFAERDNDGELPNISS